MTLVPATLASVQALLWATVGLPPSESTAVVGVKLTPSESRSTTMLTLTLPWKCYQELSSALFMIGFNCGNSLVVRFVTVMEEVMMVGVEVVMPVVVMPVMVMEKCGI